MEKYKLIPLMLLLISSFSYAENSFVVGKTVSLYNIYSGVLVYKYWSQANTYLAMKAGYHINETWADKANWDLILLSNGYVAFRNVDSKWLCMAYYDYTRRPTGEICDYDSTTQQFKLQLTSTGAVMIRNINYPRQCLKQVVNDDDNAIFGNCGPYEAGDVIPRDQLWALLPALSTAKAHVVSKRDEL